MNKGQIVGLLGENGAGKTTLLRTIATLLTPTEGHVKVDGYDTMKDEREIKKTDWSAFWRGNRAL